MYAPGSWINLEHLAVAIIRHQQVRAPTMKENVHIVRRELCGFVQRFGGLLRLFLDQPHDAEPHPRNWVLRICCSLFLNRDNSLIQSIESELRHAEKQVCATQPGFQD